MAVRLNLSTSEVWASINGDTIPYRTCPRIESSLNCSTEAGYTVAPTLNPFVITFSTVENCESALTSVNESMHNAPYGIVLQMHVLLHVMHT